MNGTFSVYGALPALGFVNRGGFGLDFIHPQCELGAVEGYRPWPPGHIVAFAGQYSRGGDFGFLEFELPAIVESLDQLKAILAYNLRHAISSNMPEWIVEGSKLLQLVPQVQEEAAILAEHAAWQKAHAARDRCSVRREWLKLALKDLADALRSFGPTDVVAFTFDGTVLSIDCGRRIIVQAEGSAWRKPYQVNVSELASLPKRLMSDPIEVSVSEAYLNIGDRGYRMAERCCQADTVAASSNSEQANLG